MLKNEKFLTIGQFAAMHGINKKTLMWYDEIGLFHPAAIHPENGYRLYTYHQSALLETILMLRELNVSIEEIQTFMKNRSAKSLERLLSEKIAELDKSLAHLKAVRKTLSSHRQNMRTLLDIDLSAISLVEKESRSLVTVDISGGISFEQSVEMITAETKKYQLRRLHDASYGTMISAESLYNGNFYNYSRLFIEIPFPIRKKGLHIQPQGKYLRTFYKGDWEKMSVKYKEILRYAKERRLSLHGFSYEMILNENVADCMEDCIVQIEIPVEISVC